MSKLIEAAVEFLSRDTSTKQIKREEVSIEEGLISALAGKIIKGAANRQTPQQIANTTISAINKKAPGTKMHNHPNFSKFKQDVHSYVSAAKSGEEAFKRSSDDNVKSLAKKYFNEEVELDEMDKSQPSSSRGAEGLPVGKKAEPAKTDKVKQDALKALQKAYKKEETDLEEDFTKMKDHEIKQWITTRQMNAMGGNLSQKRKQQYDQAQAELKKRKVTNEETSLEEQAHKVSVTVSDPNHPMVTKRNERMDKRVIVKAGNKDEAIVRAKQFYSKKGLKVHSAEYHSPQPESSMK